MSLIHTYDEAELTTRLEAVNRVRRTVFACACAELLVPLHLRYAKSRSDTEQLRASLDVAWGAAEGRDTGDVAHAAVAADSVAPGDTDAEGMPAFYAENAVAAVVYAAETWLADDHRQAVWSARQLCEAADLRAQQDLPVGADLNSEQVRQSLGEAPVVQQAVGFVESLLSSVEVEPDGQWTRVRSGAGSVGQSISMCTGITI